MVTQSSLFKITLLIDPFQEKEKEELCHKVFPSYIMYSG